MTFGGDRNSWRRRIFGFNTENRLRWVAEQASLLPAGSRVLDAGAGIGQYRALFSHCDYRTQDFGQEPATVGVYTNLDYECDITAIPVADASFDAVLCTEVIEHVPDPVAAVRELARILRPGGKLLLTAPLGSFLHQVPYHFYGGYTPYWYEKFLPEVGLAVEKIERNEGFFSLFGQEAARYREYLMPTQTLRFGLFHWPLMTAMWLLMVPMSRLLALAGPPLDALGIEESATIGYHVVAVRR